MNTTKKILVICDDADLSDLYREILQTYGFTVIDIADTVSESRKFLENNMYDTVIIDSREQDNELRKLKKIINDCTKILWIGTSLEDSPSPKIVSIIKPFNIDNFIDRLSSI